MTATIETTVVDLATLQAEAARLAEMIRAAKAAERAAKAEATRASAKLAAQIRREEFGETRGRPENTGTFDNKWGIVEGLKLIAAKDGFYHYADRGAQVSRILTLQLMEKGFVETHKAKVTEGPGRAKLFYRLTGKGKSYLALSKNWKA